MTLDGLLILTESTIAFIDDATGELTNKPLDEPAIFVTWAEIDAQRWLLADDYGRLFLLILVIGNHRAKTFEINMIGNTSRASVLVYLGNGFVFVGSHQGDSQVVRIQEGGIVIVQNLPNIAPILDFTVMDMGNRSGETHSNEYASGQARIVTGSGAFQDGSLRSIRSGVGMEEQGLLGEMNHISDLFPLTSSGGRAHSDILAASFVDETRVFRFSPEGEVEELEDFMGMSLFEGSLWLSNIAGNRLLQVTSSRVTILDLDSGMATAEWSAEDASPITVASANEEYLVVSTGGSEAIIFDLSRDLHITARRAFSQEGQISCMHVPKICPDICVVGFWQSASVAILSISNLETLRKVVMSGDAVNVPRSIALTQLIVNEAPTLLVAMANGEIVTFSVSPTNFDLGSRTATILGTQGATFKILPRDGELSNVFAICEHSSLIYGSEGRILYAAVTAEEASCVCPFDGDAYPGAIALATPKDLRIALVDTERTTHVQTLKVNAAVRRVAYSPKLKAFGIGTIYRELKTGYEMIQSHFKLADEVMFKELDSHTLYSDELVESCIRADLRDGSGELVERFVVGTAYMDLEGQDVVRGRIMVFAVTPERKLQVVSELATMGACRALDVIDGNIVAALVKTVRLSPCPGQFAAFLPNHEAPSLVRFIDITTAGHHLLARRPQSNQTSHLPHLHGPYRPFHLRLGNRHRRPYEVSLGRHLHPTHPPGRLTLPRRNSAPFPNSLGYRSGTRGRAHLAGKRRRRQPDGAEAERGGRHGGRPQEAGSRQRDPARGNGEPHPDGGGRAERHCGGGAKGVHGDRRRLGLPLRAHHAGETGPPDATTAGGCGSRAEPGECSLQRVSRVQE